jgi:putative transposase
LKRQEETSWLKEVNSQSLQFALKCLNTAYSNFFSGRTEAPVFKSRKKRKSFTVPQHVEISEGKLYFPKFKEGIKLIEHRPMSGLVKHCTISQTRTGKYFVSILCQVMHAPSRPTNKRCGIDLGIADFVVTSDEIRFENNHYLEKYQKQLATAQRHLSRKLKGSNSRNRQRLKVAAIHEKVANTRHDWLHKVSTRIANEYDIICLEDLNVKGMMANRKLAKSIADVGWGKFVRLLEYKADWNDKQFVKISRWFPSSKMCNVCGYINHELKLSERTWTCPNGHVLDRDINAAKNILNEGLRILGAGLSDNTDGGFGKTSEKKHKSMKSEAHLSSANG